MNESNAISTLGYNGEFSDPVLNQYILGNGYRAYNPTQQHFTCPDSMSPFGAGGISPYIYCEGDPINRTDPTGHMFGRRFVEFGVLAWRSVKKGAVAAVGGMEIVGERAGETVERVAQRESGPMNGPVGMTPARALTYEEQVWMLQDGVVPPDRLVDGGLVPGLAAERADINVSVTSLLAKALGNTDDDLDAFMRRVGDKKVTQFLRQTSNGIGRRAVVDSRWIELSHFVAQRGGFYIDDLSSVVGVEFREVGTVPSLFSL